METDLLIDQLASVFGVLSASKVPTTKLEKRLEEVSHRCVCVCVCVCLFVCVCVLCMRLCVFVVVFLSVWVWVWVWV